MSNQGPRLRDQAIVTVIVGGICLYLCFKTQILKFQVFVRMWYDSGWYLFDVAGLSPPFRGYRGMFGQEHVGPGVGQSKETASTELEQWVTAASVNATWQPPFSLSTFSTYSSEPVFSFLYCHQNYL